MSSLRRRISRNPLETTCEVDSFEGVVVDGRRLDLFFCPPRIPSGAEVFSEAQFRTKMLLPPRQLPHPCLLFAMVSQYAETS